MIVEWGKFYQKQDFLKEFFIQIIFLGGNSNCFVNLGWEKRPLAVWDIFEHHKYISKPSI